MRIIDHLRRVELFAQLPEEDLARICEGSELIELGPDEVLFQEGEEGEHAFIITEGEVKIIKEGAEREVLLARRHPGDVIGEIALLDSAPRMATVRTCDVVTRLVSIPKSEMDALLLNSATAARSLFGVLLERFRQTEALLRQSERMAQLGTLTAGLAHELNNPAAAVKRAADQLRETTVRYGELREAVATSGLDESGLAAASAFIEHAREQGPMLDALERSDREAAIEDLLETLGVQDAWKVSGELVGAGVTPEELEALQLALGSTCEIVLDAAATAHRTFALLHEVEEGASRLSAIVGALKGYSYLDQAPLQTVDVTSGIDDTLIILKSQLSNIDVVRDYDADVPPITAYASELNQVWTNLLANAADAVDDDGGGRIAIRTATDEGSVVIEVEDNGSGIPPEAKDRIFDAFFTTKPPGSGTGLGLDIVYNIVVSKHRGDISVESEPGRTVFTVTLPLQPTD